MVEDISWCTLRPAKSMADNIHLLKLFVVSILQELQRLVYYTITKGHYRQHHLLKLFVV